MKRRSRNTLTATATATCSAWTGTEQQGSQALPEGDLHQRVGALVGLVGLMATVMLEEHWNKADLARLASGVGPDGRDLPSNGYVAMRRLGWTTNASPAVVVSDRARRMAEESAARALRVGVYRQQIISGLVETWPEDPKRRSADEWEACWDALPPSTTKVEVRNRTRQVAAYLDEQGELPDGIWDLEAPPGVGQVALLAACDSQQVSLARTGPGRAVLAVLLPTNEHPSGYSEWSWVDIPLRLPRNVPPDAVLSTPSLRAVSNGRVAVDLPWEVPVEPPDRSVTTAVGFDWGVNRLLTGTVAKLVGQRVVVDGRSLFFNATGAAAKYHRLRKEAECLRKKIKHLERLLEGRPCVGRDDDIDGSLAACRAAHRDICTRMRHLNSAIAWAGGRWAIDQAVALGADTIFIEGLGSLEAGGLGRKVNARVSATVRTELFEAMRHLGAKVGIKVVEVPARGTSSGCPRCLRPLLHVKSPDNHSAGHPWAFCPHCGLSTDRDVAASWRIASRGLSCQPGIFARRDGHLCISKSNSADSPVARAQRVSRGKHHPTPRSTHSAPMRRRTLSAVPIVGVQQKRPERQGAQAIDSQPLHATTQLRHTHRPDGEPLGRGFHRNVQSSPVHPYGDWGPGVETTPALSLS